MKVFESSEELIGNTPMVKLTKIMEKYNLNVNLYAKLENFNLTGSSKDRIAKNMIDEAEKNGLLSKDSTIIEPTSGNTGIGIAAIASIRGYKCIIVMPDSMSKERIKMMEVYGAKVVLTEGKYGMKGSIEKAEELNKTIPNSIVLGQFDNPDNPEAHYKTTGPEIYNQMDGKIDVFVAGIGTGGTLSGVGKYLKEKNSNIKVIGVEPSSSPLLTQGYAGKHDIQGIGANFVPNTLNQEIYDEIIDVEDEEAYSFAKTIASTEGILVGISSGACLAGAIKLAKREENKNKNIVLLLPDNGLRYLSTKLFQ